MRTPLPTHFDRRRALGVVAAVLLVAAAPGGALEVPFLSGRIIDNAGLLPPGDQSALEARLAQLEGDTGAQVVILTVPSLEGDSLEDFSLRVVETWKLGREDADDGLLILVARDDRKMRLEVGYGLEGPIPDIKAKRIISDVMAPRFRNGDFPGGLAAAVDAVDGLVRGNEDALPVATGSSFRAALPERLFGGIVFIVVIGLFSLRATCARGIGGWLLYFFLMPFYLIFPLAMFGATGLIGLAVWVIGFPILRRVIKCPESLSRVSRGGWVSGGGFSGGGFSGGGGGFSGGGGSFGGGGASGSW